MIPNRFCIALLGVAVAAAFAAPAIAQAQEPGPMNITMTAGGKTQTLHGTGQCGHEQQGYIYGKRAALWTAEYPGQQRTANSTRRA